MGGTRVFGKRGGLPGDKEAGREVAPYYNTSVQLLSAAGDAVIREGWPQPGLSQAALRPHLVPRASEGAGLYFLPSFSFTLSPSFSVVFFFLLYALLFVLFLLLFFLIFSLSLFSFPLCFFLLFFSLFSFLSLFPPKRAKQKESRGHHREALWQVRQKDKSSWARHPRTPAESPGCGSVET